MANLSPIILFVYNRPWHTRQTFEALEKNDLAQESILYIYTDGAKEEATDEELAKIAEVRKLIRKDWKFKEIHIVEREKNWDLAGNIVDGVTKIVKEYGKIIVLEDDIVVSRGFIQYMNEALSLYEHDGNVGCIHAWNYPLSNAGMEESTFFLPGADCWGWATWKRAWNLFETDGRKLFKQILDKDLTYSFDRRGTHQFLQMLKDQIEEKNDSWAIRWHASLFLKNMFCLHPVKSLVLNIGLDGSGTHCNDDAFKQAQTDNISLKKIPVQDSEWFYSAYRAYRKTQGSLIVPKYRIWGGLKHYLKILLRHF